MSYLDKGIVEIAVLICGDESYTSEIHRAEDVIVNLFEKNTLSKELHIKLINTVLCGCLYFRNSGNDENIGKEYRVSVEDVSSELGSEWGEDFKNNISKVLRKEYRTAEAADVKRIVEAICFFMCEDESLSLVRNVAIFSHVFSSLKQPFVDAIQDYPALE